MTLSGDESDNGLAPGVEDVERVLARISTSDTSWRAGEARDYGSLTWRPDLARDDPPAVLHVHLAERLRPYLLDRFEAAVSAGYAVHVALPLGQIYLEELLAVLVRLDAQIHIVESEAVAAPSPLLTVLAERSITVSPDVRKALGRGALQLSRDSATAAVLGRRFEALLLFLLSQISDFRVVEHNYRTDTEELDAVVQQGSTQGRVWSALAAPFLLLEAKNWSRPVDQREVSVLRIKMQGRRGSVRIGLLCGATGFTSDARDQELRFASESLTIVFIGPTELEAWVDADDPDDFLERLIRRDMLR
jgi:hypothetical protein